MKTEGLLIINLGTPQSTSLKDIRKYLAEFLTDKRVIDLPKLLRYILVYGIIIPFRTKNTRHAYQSIWRPEGSPLMHYTQKFTDQLKQTYPNLAIAMGMRYGSPSIEDALNQLKNCKKITVLPLYPQYSSAATGSALEEVMRVLSSKNVIPSLHIIREFYQHPAYIKAQAQLIQPFLNEKTHLLLSYHGIPERQIIQSGCSSVCKNICDSISLQNQACYRAQCYETSRQLVEHLTLRPNQHSTAFQSRLGKTPWIQPYTDEILPKLIQQGVKDLVVSCPSFTMDCLETLEEIGVRLKKSWLEMGGESFHLVPCLNHEKIWIDAIIDIIPPLT